ncbi:MAG: hypothetical protein M3217_00965, partial [Actinomycetota bacterium]|nr:hypothetical protein [Actinomycetota bacterium]
APQSEQALVKQYCVSCHNARAKTGGLSLEGLDPAAAATLASYRGRPYADRFLDALVQAEETSTFRFVYAAPVHDVTGDERDDVLSLDTTIVFTIKPGVVFPTIEYETRVTIRALDGSNGEIMWTRRARFKNGYMDVVEAQVGEAGRNGFALLVFDGALGQVQQRRFTIRTLTGAGKRVWSRTWDAVTVDQFPFYGYANVPVTLGAFDADDGRATDYLVGLGNIAVAGTAWVADIHAVAVEGANGAETAHPAHEVGVGNVLPAPWVTGDLSGDGFDDYVFVNPMPQVAQGEESLEPGGVVRGRVGANGDLIWERGGYDFSDAIVVWAFPIPDVVGNPRSDVTLSAWIREGEGRDSEWDLYLVDGASGGPRWKRPGSWPYVPGDVNGDGEDDVIARDVLFGRRLKTVTVRLWAYSPSGKTLWKRSYVLRSDGPLSGAAGCSAGAGAGFGPAGDLQPDGIKDSFVVTYVSHDPGTETHERYLVDGRTGKRSLVSGEELFPLGTSLDLHGADVAKARWRDGVVEVSGATATGATLWDSVVSVGPAAEPGRVPVDVVAALLDRDRCPDIVVSITARRGRYVAALDGGDGSLLWMRTLDGVDAQPAVRTANDRNRAC